MPATHSDILAAHTKAHQEEKEALRQFLRAEDAVNAQRKKVAKAEQALKDVEKNVDKAFREFAALAGESKARKVTGYKADGGRKPRAATTTASGDDGHATPVSVDGPAA